MKQLINKLKEVEEKAENKEISIPGTIEEELTYNPFLRAETEALLSITKTDDKID